MKARTVVFITLLGPVLGALMFYFGLLGNYVVLSIDGAALIVVSVVYALTPSVRLPDTEVLNAVLRDTLDYEKNASALQGGVTSARFTPESVVISGNGNSRGAEEVRVELSKTRLYPFVAAAVSDDTGHSTKNGKFELTRRCARFLRRQGLISGYDIKKTDVGVTLDIDRLLLSNSEDGKGELRELITSPVISALCSYASLDSGLPLYLGRAEWEPDSVSLILTRGE